MKRQVSNVFKKSGERKRVNRKGWWDGECRKKKNRVRGELRKWRRGEVEKGGYKREKKEYRELCEGKKREENVR